MEKNEILIEKMEDGSVNYKTSGQWKLIDVITGYTVGLVMAIGCELADKEQAQELLSDVFDTAKEKLNECYEEKSVSA